jgi:hypothetical protein
MFVWLMFALKIPIAALLYLVWWAVRSEPAPADEQPVHAEPRPLHDPDPRLPRRPRPPRRGPHAEPPPHPPACTRAAAAAATASARTLR